jgi:periplasmic protein TonB
VPSIILLAVLMTAVGAFIFLRQGRGPAVGASSLLLDVEPGKGRLRLTWNREAPLIQKAQRAILTIGDGDRELNVDLDHFQLQRGSVVYTPLTQDVRFRLQVFDGTNATGNAFLRVLGGLPWRIDAKRSPEAAAIQPVAPTAQSQEPATTQQKRRVFTPPAAPGLKSRVAESPPEISTAGAEAPAWQGLKSAAVLPLKASEPATHRAPPPPPVAPVKVGGAVLGPTLVYRTTPVYPQIAKQARVQGTVRLDALVGKDGRVERVDVLSGPQLLREAAVVAVKQWRYTPTLLNGEPVTVHAVIDVNFGRLR